MTWSLSINVLKLGVPQFAFLGTSIYFVALWGFKIQDGEGILVVRCKIKLFCGGWTDIEKACCIKISLLPYFKDLDYVRMCCLLIPWISL